MTTTYDYPEDAEEYRRLADRLIELTNPPDDDADEGSIIGDAVERLVTFVAAQPCECPDNQDALDDEGPCARCSALGRSRDVAVPR